MAAGNDGLRGNDGLLGALQGLRRHLDQDLFPLAIGDVAVDRRMLKELSGQLDDYLLPRLTAIDAPLLAVVGGSTGAGKSTLVNSLVGADVTEPGVLRPTTLAPTLVANPADAAWFTAAHVLPGLPRVTQGRVTEGRTTEHRVTGPKEAGPKEAGHSVAGGGVPGRGTAGAGVGVGRGEPGTLRIATSSNLPAGLALLDAPDVDSVVSSNRELAAQLLAAADLWLFVTTAARYADEVPWSFLRRARERSTALAVILQRVPTEARDPVVADLTRLLRENGLAEAPLFPVPELELSSERARLPTSAVQPIATWLTGLAADARSRAAVVRQTLTGALDSLAVRVPELADRVDRQRAGIAELRSVAEGAYASAMLAFDEGMRDGVLLRGEVLARWQDFIGTGDLMRSLQSRVGRVRDRVTAVITGRPPPDRELRVALESGVESLIRAVADGAAERAVESWLTMPAGRDLLEKSGISITSRLGRASAEISGRAEMAVRAWQGYVLDLVRSEGADRRTLARAASFGVNSLGVLLMLAVFSATGGLTGIEIGIAGGTGVLSQKLLEAVFGDQAVRELTSNARADLRRRVGLILHEERSRFTSLLTGLGPAADTAAHLREAAKAVQERELL